MTGKHVVRLAPGQLGFFDPVNRLHLMYPNKMVGELPLDADLTYVRRAVKSGRLVDVAGTISRQVLEMAAKQSEAGQREEVPTAPVGPPSGAERPPEPAAVEQVEQAEQIEAVASPPVEPEEAGGEEEQGGEDRQEEEEGRKSGRRRRY